MTLANFNLKKSLLALSFLGIVSFSTNVFAHLPPLQNNSTEQHSLAPMLQKVMPAIVNISVLGVSAGKIKDKNADDSQADDEGDSNDDDSADSHSDTNLRKFISLGSGVIVDAHNGYIVTNSHVLRNAKTINVTLSDGRQMTASIIGGDNVADIAVLQIKAKNLSELPLHDIDSTKVGDFVVAIGNPYGLNQTVTSGIVSALQRTNLGIEGYENFIQTDAPINPGNSGGALVNLSGELIGINTAIFSPDGGNVGIGFAVPSNVVKSVMTQIIKYGSVRRGLMGIMVQPITTNLAEALSLADIKGALVSQVSPESPAAKAGILPGDIIRKIDNTPINLASDVTNIVGLLREGSKINLEILRNKKVLNLSLITASPKEYQKNSMANNPLIYGANLRDFSQITAIHGLVQGVQITGLAEQSPLWRATPLGLRPGDVIVSANMKPVHNTNELLQIAKTSKQLLLNVYRDTGAMFVVVKMEP